jgi:hypothetical protein
MGKPGSIVFFDLLSLELSVGSLNGAVGGITIAETGDFIHIKPETVERHRLVEIVDTLGPDVFGVGVEEIEEYTGFRPNELLERHVGILLVDEALFGLGLADIGALLSVSGTSINNRNELLVSSLPFSCFGLIEFEGARGVNAEISIVLHVRNIEPNTIKGNFVSIVGFDVSFDLIEGLVSIR